MSVYSPEKHSLQLFVMRHGEAHPFASSDSQRPLTERGQQQTREVVEQVKVQLSGVTHLFASPYKRAQQTALIVSELLNLDVETLPFITPEDDVNKLLEYLQGLPEEAVPMLVSHQPLVGILVDDLCGLLPGFEFMGTSNIAAIGSDIWANGCADLLWLQRPAQT